jgi:CheY-like chemotaxis protein
MHPTTSRTTQGLRALVLDGDASAVRVLRRALEARRFSVISAPDGSAGLDLLLDGLLDLDVLVVDLALPGRDARGFVDLIRRAGGERDLAIVVLAHEPSAELRSELLVAGVDAVIARSAGPAAAAEAALDAVHARSSTPGGAAEPPPPALPEAPAPPPCWTLSLARWSLVPA